MENAKLDSTFLRRLCPGTIRSRITYGLLVVLVLHSAVVLLNHLGLQRAAYSAAQSAEVKKDVTTLLNRNNDVIALQSHVLSFMYTGDPEMATRIRSDAAVLMKRLKESVRPIGASESVISHGKLAPLISALDQYSKKLDAVITSRGHRETILRESVDPARRRTVEVLTTAMESAKLAYQGDLAAEFADCLRLFMGAESCITGYISDPGGDTAAEFSRTLEIFRARLASLPREALEPDIAREIQAIEAGLPAWRSSVYQAISATRSFLHLVNVVLAGHALEFRTLASDLKDEALVAQGQLDARLQARQHRFQMVSTTIGALTVLVGLLAGWWISRSVSRPIVQMTTAFSALAEGEHAHLGGLSRSGEVGKLARAAEVFAKKNEESIRHLAQAEEFSDIQAATNAALQQHVEELKLRNDELDSFSYSASHDLRAPLRSIALLAEWIEEDSGELLPDDCQDHLTTLQSRARRLEKLLDGLLEYSRVGRTQDLSEPVDLLGLVDEAMADLVSPGQAKIEVRGDPVVVEAPRIALLKVIANLVVNAISHHDGESPHVIIDVTQVDKFAVLKVIDDGPGIEPLMHKKVFQIFQTCKPRDVHEATGVGLAIVQKITISNGAEVSITSDGVRGTTFTVLWPLTRAGLSGESVGKHAKTPLSTATIQETSSGVPC